MGVHFAVHIQTVMDLTHIPMFEPRGASQHEGQYEMLPSEAKSTIKTNQTLKRIVSNIKNLRKYII